MVFGIQLFHENLMIVLRRFALFNKRKVNIFAINKKAQYRYVAYRNVGVEHFFNCDIQFG